jgi:hypothetical protein
MHPHLMTAGPAMSIVALTLALSGCGGTSTVVPAGDATGTSTAATAAADRRATATTAETETETQTQTETAATASTTAPAAPAPVPDDTGGVLVERPGGFPNRGEAFILARLHPDLARRCTRADPGTTAAGAVAGLRCDTEPAFGVAAFYDLFPTTALAAGAYGRYRRANGAPLDQGNCLAPPARQTALPAEGAWRAGRALGAGRAMCLRSGDRVWLVSSHPARIVAYLSAPARAPLAPFWRATGAPTARPR